MAKDIYTDLDLHSNKISRLADGEDPTDAVTLRQLGTVSDSIQNITVSVEPPANPKPFDLWVDLSA